MLLCTPQLIFECPYHILLLSPYLLALSECLPHPHHLLLLPIVTLLPRGHLPLLSHLVFAHYPLVVLHLFLELDSVSSELLVLPPLLPQVPLRLCHSCLQLPTAMSQLFELQGSLEVLLLQLVGRAQRHGRKELEGATAVRRRGAGKGGSARMGTLGEATLFEVRGRASS